jgi:hypothetical protein
MQRIKISELNGSKIKRAVGLKKVIKTYHNKHVDKSGNFGFWIKTHKDTGFNLSGQYNREGEIISLRWGKNWGVGFYVIYETLADFMEFIREEVIKADGEIPIVEKKARKKREFDIRELEGLKVCFEVMKDDTYFSQGVGEKGIRWKELKEKYLKAVEGIREQLIKDGFKRVIVGSHGYFSFTRQTTGKFLSLDTMFSVKLLKR